MSSTIGNLLLDNNKILLIPKQEADLDAYFSTVGLAYSLLALDKEVSIFIDEQLQQGTFKNLIADSNINIIKQKDLNSLVVTLDNINSKIQEIKWEERNGKIDIYIDTDKIVNSQEKVGLKLQTQGYDTCVLVGFGDPRNLGEFYEEYKEFFKADKTIVINDKAANNIFSYKHFPVFTPTISQSIFYFIKEFNLPFADKVASSILAGLYWGTDSFAERLNKKTFSIASQLIENGADPLHAKIMGLSNNSFMQAKYFTQVFASVKTSQNNIYYSEVDHETLHNALENNLIRNMVPTSNIRGCQIAFVSIRNKDKRMYYIKNNNTSIDLQELIKEFNPEGTRLSAQFKHSIKPENFAAKLSELIANYNSEEKQQKDTPPEAKDTASTNELPAKSAKERVEQQASTEKNLESTPGTDDIHPKENEITFDTEELNKLEQKTTNSKSFKNPSKEEKTEQKPKINYTDLPEQKKETKSEQPQAKEEAANAGPLAPASKIPEPINLNKGSEAPKTSAAFNSPLPPAS